MKLKFTVLFLLWSTWLFSGNVDAFVKAARTQVGKTVTYNPEYVRLKYPMGDISISKGVCTDVIVRALRGLKIDLQERIFKDKKHYPKRYKGLYYTDRLDPNIDHRRVKNMQAYFLSRGYRVQGEFKAGDIVVWKLPGKKNLDHIGICSDKKNANGEPLVFHNINAGAKEEDVLKAYKIVDHFRLFKR